MRPLDNDAFLETLIDFAEGGSDVDITLHVNGALISGQLVSQQHYFELGLETLPETLNLPQKHEPVSDISELSQAVHEGQDITNDVIEDGEFAYLCLHLKNAMMTTGPNQQIKLGGERGLWRGRVSAVDGFALGLVDH
ncbi:hypothetical protein [Larsenimonas salina]|uniref:hypothetical protein n=1 Tax=Larsenimonas salina TaxID=1295565 RepID=UPI0020735BC2|nr:hypothetical protein [Larsenimonas salina]MCM5703634.1 hypothetical protein [Larsenimonas salina]